MERMDEGLQRILDSPESMAKIAELAKSLRAGSTANETEAAIPQIPGLSEIDPALLRVVSGAIRGYTEQNRRTRLLEALRPFAHAKNCDWIERVLQAVRIAHTARAVLNRGEGGDRIV